MPPSAPRPRQPREAAVPAASSAVPAAPADTTVVPHHAVDLRDESAVVRQQVAALDAWHRARHAQEEASTSRTQSREQRLDLARRMDVLRQQHRAIVERADQHLRDSAQLVRRARVRRAVLVHRNAWFLDKLATALQAQSVEVVAQLGNGAEAVGLAVVDQPDLMLVEDTLPMLTGVDVVREVLAYSPGTLVAAQVGHDGLVREMLAAGASAVYTRRVPPAEVAGGLAELLLGTSA